MKAAEGDYRKIAERYDSDTDLAAFLLRYASKNSAYATESQKMAQKYFPKGMKKVTLADFKGNPADGMKVTYGHWAVEDPVVKKDAVIVAINGYAVATQDQADIARNMATSPLMKLIIWDGKSYSEVQRPSVHNNFIGISYEALKPTTALDVKDPKKAVNELTKLRDNMMKQAQELQKQNLPPEEALKRLFQQNNIPGSMFEKLLRQNLPQVGEPAKPAEKSAAGSAKGKPPVKPATKRK